MRGVVERALPLLALAWDEYLKLAPRIVGFESSPEVLRIANREDNMLAVHFEVRSGAETGDLALFATPLISLEGFLQEKSRPVVAALRHDQAERAAQQHMVEVQLKRAKVPISVRFPLFALTGREIAALEVGQVIHTAQPVDTPVEVRVHGRCRFLGRMGKSSGFLGVSISRALQPGEDVSPRLPKGRIIR
jgi:flagellar motor switch protein FliM